MGATKEYSSTPITMVWEFKKWIHSAVCVKDLDHVFQQNEQPLIKVIVASTQTLIKQVKARPSSVLGYYLNVNGNEGADALEASIDILNGGPLLICGTLDVTHKDGSDVIQIKPLRFADVVHTK